jgi:hypothetical protein
VMITKSFCKELNSEKNPVNNHKTHYLWSNKYLTGISA